MLAHLELIRFPDSFVHPQKILPHNGLELHSDQRIILNNIKRIPNEHRPSPESRNLTYIQT